MTQPSLQQALDTACNAVRAEVGVGAPASYIPALAEIDPNKFGACVVPIDGATASYGDALEPFSIQSISKVFSLAVALEEVGAALWSRVGKEPSGDPFNSILQLEHEHGIPRNPFINAGAIVVADVIAQAHPSEHALTRILDFIRDRAQERAIEIDPTVAASEAAAGFRNRSLAHFLKAHGNLNQTVETVLQVYFGQCSIAMNCVQLAHSGLFLANHGRDPNHGQAQAVPAVRARRLNALMVTCGHYDASGEFAFKVGLPGKSGVGGGILAIAPSRGAIAVWSPCLNSNGNSHAGTLALAEISAALGWSIF